MRFLLKIYLLYILSLPTICVAQITVEQAHNLPLNELAYKLLGESGLIMIDVDRPRFPDSIEALIFYSHATITGSQYGLCGADWVTIDFDENGLVSTLRAEKRYGVAGNIQMTSEWTYDEYAEICAGVKSTRNYFPAPDGQSAIEISRYVEAIAGNGPFAKQNFEYSCTGLCKSNKDDLRWLKLSDIFSAHKIECPPSNFEYPSCFEVSVGEYRAGPFPKSFKIYGIAHNDNVIITRISADIGSTLH